MNGLSNILKLYACAYFVSKTSGQKCWRKLVNPLSDRVASTTAKSFFFSLLSSIAIRYRTNGFATCYINETQKPRNKRTVWRSIGANGIDLKSRCCQYISLNAQPQKYNEAYINQAGTKIEREEEKAWRQATLADGCKTSLFFARVCLVWNFVFLSRHPQR